MDVFARLSNIIAGGPAARATSTTAKSTPSDDSNISERASSSGRRRQLVQQDSGGTSVAFKDNWRAIQSSLFTPDQAALHHGIARTDLKVRLGILSDALVSEASHSDEEDDIAGPCMEALLEGDLLGRLVKLTANDRIAGSQAEVVRLFASLIILLDERFLSRQAVHRPLVRLMRICVGDEFFNSSNHGIESENEDEEVKAWRRFGRDGSAEVLGFEEDLVDLMCHVASRLRNTPELLIIFFRDRGGDAEAKRAFNRALTGAVSPQSMPGSKTSTRPTSPSSSSISSSATIKATMPAISSPLRPPQTLPMSIPSRGTETSSNVSTSTSLTYDFPLFSYLLRFVHRESRTGELARAGLLFLVDVAFAPDRKNMSRVRQREGNGTKGGRPSRGSRVGSSTKRGGASSSARIRIDIDFGLGPSLALARYMIESDFAEVLGASLGAVYGLLPRKLAASRDTMTKEGKEKNLGMSLGGTILPSVEAESLHKRGIVLNSSDEVRKQARLLCDLLEFTQDILRTTSRMPIDLVEVGSQKRSYLDLVQVAQILTASIGSSIQKLYLENILYPSLLECSDVDGSAVAVMTYLDLMLSVLESDGVLAEFIVGWLVGQEQEHDTSKASLAIGAGKKRKSTAMLQLEREKGSKQEQMEYFADVLGRYTVKDLILDNLNAKVKPEAMVSALNLTSTIVTYYGRYALENVLQVIADDSATSFPNNSLPMTLERQGSDSEADSDDEEFIYPGASEEDDIRKKQLKDLERRVVKGVAIAQHRREMTLYLSLANTVELGTRARADESTISSKDSTFPSTFEGNNSSTGFDNYLEDTEQNLFRDSMFWEGIYSLKCGQENIEQNLYSYRHRIASHDPLLRSILEGFCHFWQNAPETNVALTGLVADLAICPFRGLEGFIVFDCQGWQEEEEAILSVKDSANEEDDRSDDEKRFAISTNKTRKKKKKKKTEKSSKKIKQDKSSPAPILLCILRSLVTMLDHYRPEVHGFDRLLRERRKGLLYVENLNEALQVNGDDFDAKDKQLEHYTELYKSSNDSQKNLWEDIKMEREVVESHIPRKHNSRTKQISLPPPPSALPLKNVTSKSGEQSTSGTKREGFARFFGRGSSAKSSMKTVEIEKAINLTSTPEPFAQHYQETSSLFLEMDRLRISKRSKWSLEYKAVEEDKKVKEKKTRFRDVDGDSDEENFMYPGADEDKMEKEAIDDKRRDNLVNLSSLLDNAVILEEFLKEIAAILEIRRSNGVDAISFV